MLTVSYKCITTASL